MKENNVEIKEMLADILKKISNDPNFQIKETGSVCKDYGLDSIQFVQFMVMTENNFHIKLSDEFLEDISNANLTEFVMEIEKQRVGNE